MELLSPKHVLLILLIVLIVFASGRLRYVNGSAAKLRAARPLRLWLVAAMALVALMLLAFALR